MIKLKGTTCIAHMLEHCDTKKSPDINMWMRSTIRYCSLPPGICLALRSLPLLAPSQTLFCLTPASVRGEVILCWRRRGMMRSVAGPQRVTTTQGSYFCIAVSVKHISSLITLSVRGRNWTKNATDWEATLRLL